MTRTDQSHEAERDRAHSKTPRSLITKAALEAYDSRRGTSFQQLFDTCRRTHEIGTAGGYIILWLSMSQTAGFLIGPRRPSVCNMPNRSNHGLAEPAWAGAATSLSADRWSNQRWEMTTTRSAKAPPATADSKCGRKMIRA
jgi:hypothetical protein